MEHFYHTVEQGGFNHLDHDFYKKAIDWMPDSFIAVEVGSWKGNSSASLVVEAVNSHKGYNIYCVDTWEGSPDEPCHQNDLDVRSGRLFDVFEKNMLPVEGLYTAKKGDSVNIAATFLNNSLDFVFIDADHKYDSVYKDVTAWLPKLKSGGVLAGHDVECHDIVRAINLLLPGWTRHNNSNCWYYNKP